MKYILSLDQGTTSSRAMLIDHEGHVKGIAQKEFRQHFPSPGWVEHDPMEIWSTQASVATEVLVRSGITPAQIAAIGITNQRETTIIWDKQTGMPIAPAIVWQDRRTTEYCQRLKDKGLEPLFKQKTGLLLDPYFSGTKIHWILNHIPGSQEMAQQGKLAFGTVDSWLIWKLTDGKLHITDMSNASRTLLFNLHTCSWDEELLDILQIPRSLLPEVRSSSEVYGNTSHSLFSLPIPISGIAGDQQAALFGQACFKSGMAKTTYGTGCFMLMNTGNKPVLSKNNLLTTIAYQINGQVEYALEGSVFIGGAVVQWLRDNLNLFKKSADIEKLAQSVPDSGGVYFVPAFTGLGAPHWDPYTRGTLLGITRGTQAAHIARAALEGIAFQVTDVLHAMQNDAQINIQELRVDGGAVRDNLLMQFQADLLGVPTIRPQMTELTALGAAFLAGLAVDFWKNQEEIARYWKEDRTFIPSMDPDSRRTLRSNWDRAIACAKLWGGKST
ncbi:MAG: glycerol kinase GlpK [Rhabdochlamydiaceae bacterium]|nr:glycerol kinase GlpK [Rhabdochlamydiaceae bacterium]